MRHARAPAVVAVCLAGGDDDPRSSTPSFAAFCARGREGGGAQLAAPEALDAGAVASLVYTSGTTGDPKAVELTHASVAEVVAMMHARIPLGPDTVIVSYLPLSHIAAQGIDVFSAIYCGAEVHFADADALRGSLKATLLRVRPTLFFGVPRVWEKLAAAMKAKAAEAYAKPGAGPALKAIGAAAKAVGAAWYSPRVPDSRAALAPPFALARALVFKKARKGCGLDRCALLYTGAAPLPEGVLSYLRSVDMPLLEVFGMSESCGAIAVCGPTDAVRPAGACGRALPRGALEIAPDGEVLWRGANNMRGYRGLPAETDKALKDGLHTGDLGEVDAAGFVRITGRKKDLIITAGGENVAPTPIEEALGELLERERAGAGHVVLVGDGRKFLACLVAPADDGHGRAAALPEREAVAAALAAQQGARQEPRAARAPRARARGAVRHRDRRAHADAQAEARVHHRQARGRRRRDVRRRARRARELHVDDDRAALATRQLKGGGGEACVCVCVCARGRPSGELRVWVKGSGGQGRAHR